MTSPDDSARGRKRLASTAVILAALMCFVSVAGFAAKPTKKVRDSGSVISLEKAVPKTFADWVALPEQTSLIVNPQAEEALFGIYSQVLSRTYVDRNGYRVMLSVAYNEDQRGDLQTHRPEACYPAQGFRIGPTQEGLLPTAFGDIDVRRLATTLGPRKEPVTYWVTVGDRVVNDRMQKRFAEMRMAIAGEIPDGLLFRISSIDEDPARAYAAHQKFAADMMGSVPFTVRKRLSGLSPATLPG